MATLLYENGLDRGNGVEFEVARTYTLGRDPRCDVVVRDDLVSRQHCKVKEFKGGWYVRDLESRNGILVNDRRVRQAQLHDGDKLQLGDSVFTFLLESLQQVRQQRSLGGYRLLRRIGRGGMGTVFRAVQVSLEREVALKVLSSELVRDEKFVRQFPREARAAGQLNHPNIVQVYDVGNENSTYYYSMEYIRGGSLEDRLREAGTLPPAEVLAMALEVARALEYAEAHHIVHRDIKPDNFMLTEDGHIKVADLGLALSLKETAEQAGQPILGTPHFISPEQALRREVDIRSDIYSLGATLYRSLSGRTVFQGDTIEEIVKKAVREEPVPLREVAPDVPEKLADLVHRMLHKDPDARPESAAALREELEHLTRRPGRTVALWSSVTVAVLAICVAIVLAIRGPQETFVEVPSEDIEAARRQAFEAMDEQNKVETQLGAVQALLGVVASGREGRARRDAFAAWIQEHDYLPLPTEIGIARREVEAFDAEQRALAERAAQVLAERTARLETATTGVEEALGRNDFAAAFLAALALDPQVESEPEGRAEVETRRGELLGRTTREAQAAFDRARDDVEAATAVDLETAAVLCQQSADAFPAPPEELPEAGRELLGFFHQWFPERRRELLDRLAREQAAALHRDLTLVVGAYDQDFRRTLLEVDFEAAAQRLETALQELASPGYRALVEPTVQRLRNAAAIRATMLTQLADGLLAKEPLLELLDGEAELLEFDPQTGEFKVQYERNAGGAVAYVKKPVPLAQFASYDGLHALVLSRMELSPADLVEFTAASMMVEICRWVEELAELRQAIQHYDPESGWSPDLLASTTDPSTANGNGRVLVVRVPSEQEFVRDLGAAAQTEAGLALIAEFERELRMRERLLHALDPFLRADSRVGWATAAAEIRAILEQPDGSLLLRLVHPWLDASCEHPLLPPAEAASDD